MVLWGTKVKFSDNELLVTYTFKNMNIGNIDADSEN